MVLQTMCTTLKSRKCGVTPCGCPTTATGIASHMSSYSTLIHDATSNKAPHAAPGENCAARMLCSCASGDERVGMSAASAGCRTAARRTWQRQRRGEAAGRPRRESRLDIRCGAWAEKVLGW